LLPALNDAPFFDGNFIAGEGNQLHRSQANLNKPTPMMRWLSKQALPPEGGFDVAAGLDHCRT
jgi:hypothetical protein